MTSNIYWSIITYKNSIISFLLNKLYYFNKFVLCSFLAINDFTSFSLQRGDYATFDVVEFINLLESNSGIDLLQFDSAPGAQGAGFYTMQITELNAYADYNINFNVISSVPIPAAFWLFGSGVVCLIGVARRK